jgi:hypothetical protein
MSTMRRFTWLLPFLALCLPALAHGQAAGDPPAPTGDATPVRPVPPREATAVPPPRRVDPVPVAPAAAAKPPVKKRSKPAAWMEKLKKLLHLGDVWQPELLLHLKFSAGEGTAPNGATNAEYNDFRVTRGYFGVKIKPTRWLEARLTTDTRQDDTGDFKVRLKYAYARFVAPVETVAVSEPYVMAGMISTPWISFEEGLNPWRMQGTMFTERNKRFGSADLGVMAGVLLGRKLSRHYQDTVSSKEPGTWGSLAVGLYNGGGYSAFEKNRDKVLHARATLRPLGPIFPNLQLSYVLVYGKGNVDAEIPDWQNHVIAASFEHRFLGLVGQYAAGKGVQKGQESGWINGLGHPRHFQGASAFLEVKLPWIWSSVIGRYDWFDGPNASGTTAFHRIIGGYAFHFWGRNKNVLLLDVDYSIYDGVPNQWAVSLTLQVAL